MPKKQKDFQAEFNTVALLEQARKLVSAAGEDPKARRAAVQAVVSQVIELRDMMISLWESVPYVVRQQNPQLRLDLERWMDRVGLWAPPALELEWKWQRAIEAALLRGRAEALAIAKEDDLGLLLANQSVSSERWPSGRPDVILGWSLANQLNVAAAEKGWNTRDAFTGVLSTYAGVGEDVLNVAIDEGYVTSDAGRGLLGIVAEARTNPEGFLSGLKNQLSGLVKKVALGVAIYFGFKYFGGVNGE